MLTQTDYFSSRWCDVMFLANFDGFCNLSVGGIFDIFLLWYNNPKITLNNIYSFLRKHITIILQFNNMWKAYWYLVQENTSLNLKWILCDARWKKVYDKLLASKMPNVQESLNIWYPNQIQRKIDEVSNKFPKCKDRHFLDLSTGTQTTLAECELKRYKAVCSRDL